MAREPRPIYYAATAGDILGTYVRWLEGRRDERQLAATYSGQFFDLCTKLSRAGAVSFPSRETVFRADSQFVLRNRPATARGKGLRFHLCQLRNAGWLFSDIVRSGASDVIVMDGVTHYFLLAPLAWAGRRVFLSIHTVLWREGRRATLSQRLIRTLDRWFFRHYCAGCLAASSTISDQVRQLANGVQIAISIFNPLYNREDFERFRPPIAEKRPFHILYAGRIEDDKGVFDLFNNVRDLVLAGQDIHLDYCGDGTALPRLQEAVIKSGLSDRVRMHGHLTRLSLLEKFDEAQIVVVPTRSSFPEGLNQVVIEAVLARRPVITSNICPALDLIRPAAVAAAADDCESFRAAISRLMSDQKLFCDKITAGAKLRENFFDRERAWTSRALQIISEKGISL